MKSAIAGTAAVIAGAAAIAASALGQSAAPSTRCFAHKRPSHRRSLPYAETAPLFGPERGTRLGRQALGPAIPYPQPGKTSRVRSSRCSTDRYRRMGQHAPSIREVGISNTFTSFRIIMVTVIDVRFKSDRLRPPRRCT